MHDKNTNDCGTQQLIEEDCEDYAQEYKYTWGGMDDEPGFPKGCYLYDEVYVYYNTHESGGINDDSQPVCGSIYLHFDLFFF